MYESLLIIFLIVAISLVSLILLQKNQGTDIGISSSSGSSNMLFSSIRSGNFMTRITAILAMLFFIISLILGNLSSNKLPKENKWDNASIPNKYKQQTYSTKLDAPINDIPQ